MFIYAIVNKSNKTHISYFSNVVEACIEFNKYYCLQTHSIKRYNIKYENDVGMKEIFDVITATLDIDARAFDKISLNAVQDEVDKGYTTTMLRGRYATTTCREKKKHTNPKFRKFHEQMQKHDGHSETWWNRFPDKHDTEQ